jgi:hypothetical protein
VCAMQKHSYIGSLVTCAFRYVAQGGVQSAITVKGGSMADYCVSAPTTAPTKVRALFKLAIYAYESPSIQTPTSTTLYPTPAPTHTFVAPPAKQLATGIINYCPSFLRQLTNAGQTNTTCTPNHSNKFQRYRD